MLACTWIWTQSTAYGQTDSTAQTINRFAAYPGGAENFFEYIRTNLNYPADAQADSVQGVVYVAFEVMATGAIDDTSVQVEKSVSPTCDAEAIRIIRSAPDWLPATAGGMPTTQAVTFPVEFIWKSAR